MKHEIKIPAMGESISEVTIGEILKPSGSEVEADEEILELETDKVNQVLYAPEAGTLKLSVKTDDTVKIGEVIGHIEEGGKQKEKEKGKKEKAEKETEKEEGKEEEKPKKKREEEKQVRITREEFVKELKEGAPPREEKRGEEEERESRARMPRIRQVIASRLVEAKQQTAMLTTFNEADMSALLELRAKHQEAFIEEYQVKLGLMSFFVKASLFALKKIPEMNSYIEGEEIVRRNYYDIGVAVGTERGLFVPVLRDCDRLSFAEIEKQILEYASQARSGNLPLEAIQGGGFTITNGGVYGSLLSTPILNPPQCGILGMHKIEKRAVVLDDEVAVRPMMYLALSYDHRLIDGRQAVTFLVHVKECLEEPARLALEI